MVKSVVVALAALVLVSGCGGSVAGGEGQEPSVSTGSGDPAAACMAAHGCAWEAPFWHCPRETPYPADCALQPHDCGYAAQFSCSASGMDSPAPADELIFSWCAAGCSPRYVEQAGTDDCSVTCAPSQ